MIHVFCYFTDITELDCWEQELQFYCVFYARGPKVGACVVSQSVNTQYLEEGYDSCSATLPILLS